MCLCWLNTAEHGIPHCELMLQLFTAFGGREIIALRSPQTRSPLPTAFSTEIKTVWKSTHKSSLQQCPVCGRSFKRHVHFHWSQSCRDPFIDNSSLVPAISAQHLSLLSHPSLQPHPLTSTPPPHFYPTPSPLPHPLTSTPFTHFLAYYGRACSARNKY